MTTGEGIIWSTVLILVVASAWRISANGSWKKVIKIFGSLLLFIAAIAIGVEIYKWFDRRPKKFTGLQEIELGMLESEVLVNLGQPAERNDQESYYVIFYSKSYDPEYRFSVSFDKKSKRANMICEEGDFTDLYINTYLSEKDIEDRFGKPTTTFVNPDGKFKSLSYPKYNLTFLFSQKRLLRLCVTENADGYLA